MSFVYTIVVLAIPSVSEAATMKIKINSIPSGATVYVSGQKVGVTPITIKSQGRYWYEVTGSKRPIIKVEKPGYAPKDVDIQPSEVNIPVLICAFCCLIPILWAFELPSEVTVQLIPL